VATFLVWLGSWLSGYLIIATDAWMQHPVAYSVTPDGNYSLASFWGLLLNPWALWQYAHNMLGAVQTGCFVMAAVGAFYLLSHKFETGGRIFLRVAVIVGVFAAVFQLFPTGDEQGVFIAHDQQPTLAAMEGLFKTSNGAPLAILGQPDVENRKLDNPLIIPNALSFLTYRAWKARVRGLDSFPESEWPDRIPLLYYSYHVMVGLGTLFIAIMVIAAFLLLRHTLYSTRWMLWILLLAFPFPYIANTAGWITAEVGRQPYLIYGLMRTPAGISPRVSAGNAWFTLIGFLGMYMVLGILFLFLVYREIERGPEGPITVVPHAGGMQPEEN
jgi:cytochrome d ubiquinol oxidase subunit I